MRVIPAREISAELLRRWNEIQQGDNRFASAYFRPEYTVAVSQVRDDVFVAVMEDAGRVVGFLPFERTARRTGRPVGLKMSNYQGVIVDRGVRWIPEELVRACGLSILDFDHLICEQEPLVPYHESVARSPVVDISSGWDAYVAERRQSGSRAVASAQRKMRKLEREIGPLRFTPHTADPAVLRLLVEWKREQYQRTQVYGSLMQEWAVRVCDNILAEQHAQFAGMLSVLHAGDEVLAIHMGMRSDTHWHWWYPSYDRRYASYSPGVILLLKMAEWGPAHGIRLIDLGRGATRYKTSFGNGHLSVARASIILPSLSGYLRRVQSTTRRIVRASPLLAPLVKTVRQFRRRQRANSQRSTA